MGPASMGSGKHVRRAVTVLDVGAVNDRVNQIAAAVGEEMETALAPYSLPHTGRSGSISTHSASVTSLGKRNSLPS